VNSRAARARGASSTHRRWPGGTGQPGPRERASLVQPALGKSTETPLIYHDRQLSAIAARWDARAPGWDLALESSVCHLNEDDAYPRFLREAREVIKCRRNFCKNHGVVDAGCGTGLVLARVISCFAWGAGVDISPEMIRAARRKRIPKASFLVGDCFNLAKICPHAGAILSRGVLLSHYGWEQGEALLAAALPALVDGGFLIFDFLNRLSIEKHTHSPEAKTYFTAEEMCHLACRAGFSNPKVLGGEARRVLILLAQA